MMTTVELELSELVRLVERATLAPSRHNTQPWRWTVTPEGAELELDPDRVLPLGDPGGREATIACGAALFTFRVAAAHLGLGVEVEVLPDPEHDTLLARVRLQNTAVDAEFAALDAEVPVRRAWHGALRTEPVPAAVRARLAAEAHAEGAVLVEVPAASRDAVARLVAAADAERGVDARWRAEQARWVRARSRREGIPVVAPALLPTRLVVRYLDLGGLVGARESTLVRAAPVLAVLGTQAEDRAGWLAAGQALQRVLLVAAEHGLVVGFANSACEDPARRTALAALLGGSSHPQVVLRLGRGPGTGAGPASAVARLTRSARLRRRPVGDVLDVRTEPAQRKSTSPVSTS